MGKYFAGAFGLIILAIIAVIAFDTPEVKATYSGTIVGAQASASTQYHDGSPGQLTDRPYHITALIEVGDKQLEVRLEDKARFDILQMNLGRPVQVEYIELSSGLGSLYRLTKSSKDALFIPLPTDR